MQTLFILCALLQFIGVYSFTRAEINVPQTTSSSTSISSTRVRWPIERFWKTFRYSSSPNPLKLEVEVFIIGVLPAARFFQAPVRNPLLNLIPSNLQPGNTKKAVQRNILVVSDTEKEEPTASIVLELKRNGLNQVRLVNLSEEKVESFEDLKGGVAATYLDSAILKRYSTSTLSSVLEKVHYMLF